jgi:hypothetical protein
VSLIGVTAVGSFASTILGARMGGVRRAFGVRLPNIHFCAAGAIFS